MISAPDWGQYNLLSIALKKRTDQSILSPELDHTFEIHVQARDAFNCTIVFSDCWQRNIFVTCYLIIHVDIPPGQLIHINPQQSNEGIVQLISSPY